MFERRIYREQMLEMRATNCLCSLQFLIFTYKGLWLLEGHDDIVLAPGNADHFFDFKKHKRNVEIRERENCKKAIC